MRPPIFYWKFLPQIILLFLPNCRIFRSNNSTEDILSVLLFRGIFMSIPEEIRRVPRPTNTVVVLSGSKGAKLYAVRERAGVTYGANGKPQPINGRVIGHIFGGKFVPLIAPIACATPDMLSYGAAAFVQSCTDDLLQDLYASYAITDAQRVMAMAALRVLKPRLSSRRLNTEYRRTFISVYYPDLAMSENTISKFLQDLGKDGAKRKAFYARRISTVINTHHVAIDGTLKQDTSNVNDLSAFSRKARLRGTKDISILYAYDIEKREPICAEVFPGNVIDATAYSAFIRDNNLQKGIILSDKGFPPSQIADELKKRPDLHFLTPLKRNDSRIKHNRMYEFTGVLSNYDKAILYKKVKLSTGRFLYSFRDTGLAFREEINFANHAKRHDDFDAEKYQGKKDAFGTIVLESDQDLDPTMAYMCYADRWEIESVFRLYKNDDGLDQTEVQGDFSICGSEFINFIATTLTCRMLKKAQAAGLLEKDSWIDLMDDLSSAWRRTDGTIPARSDDDAWVHTRPGVMQILEKLNLSQSAIHKKFVTETKTDRDKTELKTPGKVGRHPGSHNTKKVPTEDKPAQPPTAKKGRGRPRGSKNKATLEREAREAREALEAQRSAQTAGTPASGSEKGAKQA